MKIIKDNKILNVTEKAYRVVYKTLGYKPLEEEIEEVIAKEETEEEKKNIFVVDINDITKDKIIEILTNKEIEHNPRDKKEVLYNLMIEGD